MENEAELTEADNRREAQDEVIVAALAAGRSYEDAGAMVGVSTRTVARRMADATFARRVGDRRGEQVQLVAGQLNRLGEAAVAAVASCLHDEDARVRLSAAKVALELTLRFRHQTDLEVSVREVRQHLGMDT